MIPVTNYWQYLATTVWINWKQPHIELSNLTWIWTEHGLLWLDHFQGITRDEPEPINLLNEIELNSNKQNFINQNEIQRMSNQTLLLQNAVKSTVLINFEFT